MKKKHMRYRSKLFIALFSLGALSSCVNTKVMLGVEDTPNPQEKNLSSGGSSGQENSSSTDGAEAVHNVGNLQIGRLNLIMAYASSSTERFAGMLRPYITIPDVRSIELFLLGAALGGPFLSNQLNALLVSWGYINRCLPEVKLEELFPDGLD